MPGSKPANEIPGFVCQFPGRCTSLFLHRHCELYATNSVYFGGAVAHLQEIADKVYASHIELHSAFSDTASKVAQRCRFLKCDHSGAAGTSTIRCSGSSEAGSATGCTQWLIFDAGNLQRTNSGKKNGSGLMPDVSGMEFLFACLKTRACTHLGNRQGQRNEAVRTAGHPDTERSNRLSRSRSMKLLEECFQTGILEVSGSTDTRYP